MMCRIFYRGTLPSAYIHFFLCHQEKCRNPANLSLGKIHMSSVQFIGLFADTLLLLDERFVEILVYVASL